MSNISIFSDPSVPANVTPRGLSPLTQSIAVGGGSLRRIQTNTNGTFRRLVGGEQLGKAIRGEFNAIIVALLPKVGRTYYEAQYDPTATPTLPDCWSNDGVTPETESLNVQSPTCNACPNNIVGSGQNGQGRACRYQRRVALLLEGDTTGDAYQFNIPAKSLFGKGQGHTHPFESYVKYLVANQQALDYVVTKIAYDLEADTMQMNFTPVRPITDEEYALVLEAQQDPETQRLIKITVSEASAVAAVPNVKKQPSAQAEALRAAALAAQAAAEAEEEEEEEEVAPIPAPKPKAVAPKPKPKPAPVVEEEEEPAPPPKPKAVAPKPVVAANPFDGEDDEDELPALPVRRSGPKPKTAPPTLKPELADVLSDWAAPDDGED